MMVSDPFSIARDRPIVILALEIVSIVLALAEIAFANVGSGIGAIVEIAISVFFLALALMVTRWRSGMARWILTAFFLIGAALLILELATAPTFIDLSLISATTLIGISGLSIVQMALLWTIQTSRWVSGHEMQNPQT